MTKILVAEDDAQLNRILCACLSDRGYEATGCPDAAAALAKMDETHYDMIVTDVMMPGMDGFAFAAAVRATDKKIPILFLTAREDLASKQRGYSIGIDDYVVKPVDFEELLLRIGALLRRAEIAGSRRLQAGNLTMDESEHTAYVDGEELPLTVREFDILYKLLSFPKKNLHPRAADGGVLGLRFLLHLPHGGRVHGKAARKDRRLRRVRDRDRARAGL